MTLSLLHVPIGDVETNPHEGGQVSDADADVCCLPVVVEYALSEVNCRGPMIILQLLVPAGTRADRGLEFLDVLGDRVVDGQLAVRTGTWLVHLLSLPC